VIEKILLLASFLLFLAVAVEAKVRSRLGLFIVISGLVVGFLSLFYLLIQAL